ncbi:transmembrane protein 273 isoform X2 [Physeter macrocephalus]|uniref:Transmembrane protein 273 isoform X2 n=1 Tax=Physeter macrocephalus TaxID=9755 RepID=A0A455B0R3_PHYMC|nr:transmembrane protein 273 isoform X2 [Physeter catodon]|eukprot:XP_028342094.1 transmembrane protein 273 isoform X4 [Physeter catodon]
MGKYSRCGTPRGADVGAAQVLATGQPAGAKIGLRSPGSAACMSPPLGRLLAPNWPAPVTWHSDFKSAIIGIAVGFAISASFLVLKICRIRKHLFDNDSSKQRSTNVGFNGQEIMLSPISTFA